ncbi:hypothetical protein J2S14_002190 [Lederbergia wuyishanensis]|uniref:Uncharacterized protein n=1 Tax=Lederbergia wuyishanensis TaxID=1347903 RepID=A0ABU0D4S8_9BACI|nr:hypothetical protein [Lederbergia wuyishanensis]
MECLFFIESNELIGGTYPSMRNGFHVYMTMEVSYPRIEGDLVLFINGHF